MRGQLEGQIQTVPGEIQTAVTPRPSPSLAGADNTNSRPHVLDDLSTSTSRSTAVPTPASTDDAEQGSNGLATISSAPIVSIDHTFNAIFSGEPTIDFTYDNATASVGGQKVNVTGCAVAPPWQRYGPSGDIGPAVKYPAYIKKAYLQAKVNDALIFRARRRRHAVDPVRRRRLRLPLRREAHCRPQQVRQLVRLGRPRPRRPAGRPA